MCGISGLINKNNESVSKELLSRMNDLIFHRGPDDEGFYYNQMVGLGHRRLSIIDLSKRGHQPMSYQARWWITYNGEIYNYLEIREELLKLGHSFQSDSDTEVILAAYVEWGNACLEKFNGMWSFAIYDQERNQLFISRDRFGIKPFYYINTDEHFAFGSEIKQLLSLQREAKVNKSILVETLLTSYDNHTTETYFEGIFSLPQGSYMTYDLNTHEMEIKPFYELKVNPEYANLSHEEAIEKLKQLLEDATALRMRSDVTVGTCLSGGLDSSSISAIASQIYHHPEGKKFIAVNAKSIDSRNDESNFAEMVSKHLDLDMYCVAPGTDDFIKQINELVYTQEEPFLSPSMFMGWHVFQEANERGCKVMLNGQGGDEVLLGYERYFSAFLKSLGFLSQVKESYLQFKNSRLGFFQPILYYFYFTNANLRIIRLKNKSFVKKEYVDKFDFAHIRQSAKAFRNIFDMQKNELTVLQLPHLLRYEDRNSMRHSIETRLPMLDYRLVEFAVSIPANYKIRKGWTKDILRHAITDRLPDKIVWRKNKFGFEAPERIWLRAHREEMKKAISESTILNETCDMDRLMEGFAKLPLSDQWLYFNVAKWQEVFKVS
uniref:asparagine synthase (glutamine-hydrolyzing) n=1 Tax=Roseivirga sp. TaxID=1964215 RepID=UPI00404748C0